MCESLQRQFISIIYTLCLLHSYLYFLTGLHADYSIPEVCYAYFLSKLFC